MLIEIEKAFDWMLHLFDLRYIFFSRFGISLGILMNYSANDSLLQIN